MAQAFCEQQHTCGVGLEGRDPAQTLAWRSLAREQVEFATQVEEKFPATVAVLSTSPCGSSSTPNRGSFVGAYVDSTAFGPWKHDGTPRNAIDHYLNENSQNSKCCLETRRGHTREVCRSAPFSGKETTWRDARLDFDLRWMYVLEGAHSAGSQRVRLFLYISRLKVVQVNHVIVACLSACSSACSSLKDAVEYINFPSTYYFYSCIMYVSVRQLSRVASIPFL